MRPLGDRVRLVDELLEVLFGSFAAVPELEKLVIEQATSVPPISLSALPNCASLRTIVVEIAEWSARNAFDRPGVEVGQFVAALPPGLKALKLSASRRCRFPDSLEALAGLPALESFGVENMDLSTLALLEPVAPRLRTLSLDRCDIDMEFALPCVDDLEELRFTPRPGGYDLSMLQLGIICISPNLICVSIRPRCDDLALSAALENAMCAESLRVLALDFPTLDVSSFHAIGTCLKELEELELRGCPVTVGGLTDVGRGCVGLTKLTLWNYDGVDDTVAAAISI